MHNLKAILSIASLALLSSSCANGDFDALEKSAWAQSDGKGGLSSAGFGAGLVATGSTTDGLKYFVAADLPGALVLVTFNQSGDRKAATPTLVNDTISGAQQLQLPPTLASDLSGFGSTAMGNVAVGVFDGNAAALLMIQGSDGVSTGRFLLAGGKEPSGIAFGNSDALDATDGSDGVDLFALSGVEVNLLANYQNLMQDAPANSCSLAEGDGELLVAEVDSDVANPEAELLVSVGNEVLVTTGARLQGAMTADPKRACFEATGDIATEPLLATITAPGGEASFGGLLAQGYFDDDKNDVNAAIDLVIAAPEDNAVYVFMNWTVGAPSVGEKIATPGGAVRFGSSIAVGDFNGDGRDELVVGDPGRDIAAHPAAGKAYIFETSPSGVFQAPHELHDARAEDNQAFATSLTVAEAFGEDALIVGASDEVFTYFRTPVSGDEDFRP